SERDEKVRPKPDDAEESEDADDRVDGRRVVRHHEEIVEHAPERRADRRKKRIDAHDVGLMNLQRPAILAPAREPCGEAVAQADNYSNYYHSAHDDPLFTKQAGNHKWRESDHQVLGAETAGDRQHRRAGEV